VAYRRSESDRSSVEDIVVAVGRPRRHLYDAGMSDPSPDARATLVAERDRLHADLAERIVAPGPMTYGSQAAAATQVFEQQRDLALREKNEQHLAAVELALARLDDGTFGTCARCSGPIAPERLEALPWAAYCIDCQRIVGRGG
jgi:RNA polymerase-binding transcription factor DksA